MNNRNTTLAKHREDFLTAEIISGLPEKMHLHSEVDVIICIKNNTCSFGMRRITIDPSNLLISNIIEERESSKSIIETRSFTLEEFNLMPRILDKKYLFRIVAKFKALVIGVQYLNMLINYDRISLLTEERESLVLTIEALNGAKTEVIP
ncbi:hypothetical protein RVIR1_09030 [Candidatus Rickettsiella viridis]|uniref:Uncharacterized protein n=1 Tax=Candidatus Rickettsiella viridis TaxID=676208 RepID=A0A2Z5UWK8_9COXI|nr:hypothetical protein [Candidatus Rickettsiella viridis]BBB15383.1 hypothetical protein RVIR1_09030 [Candidatus Rickettsiella viridis]